ncbi:GlmU family protein [Raineya orbicola]|uniref:UDP-N-acetylglucosamine diphosphorylase/glucosamine-1-phosphate N-acetyltransferase n=1 Tax=Raineya orbicola TaxID=2016530 RepID=A0A2N3IHZ6_9BACT|nr:GlmU family protein [Raineya orbicola]PKQ69878.1 UDP-N-acetylglucosamine diphosphorylase/glucosamine-1-phosphate N-acetyltransferase [Raineya orbicola]
MNFILFDAPQDHANLLPLTFVRPISEIRIGILTIREKWEKYLQTSCSYQTESYLSEKYSMHWGTENIFINASVLPSEHLAEKIKTLSNKQALYAENTLIAYRNEAQEKIFWNEPIRKISYPFDIFSFNGSEIQADFQIITRGRKSQPIEDKHTIIYKPENIFIEEGADLKACVLNAEKGVIYIGKNAQVQEMSVIQGNFALCEGAVINIGGKMRGDTTIGNYCKVGGEISNSVIFGYSNKAHDGFLGNSVIAEWCNLGADTNTSNLKNNYSNVKIWNFLKGDFIDTQKQFCGLIMGDYCKAGINTMFNTGTVAGISCNIFGGDFPPKFIPSFSWGGAKGFEIYELTKFFGDIEKMMARRGKTLSEQEKAIIRHCYHNNKPSL